MVARLRTEGTGVSRSDQPQNYPRALGSDSHSSKALYMD